LLRTREFLMAAACSEQPTPLRKDLRMASSAFTGMIQAWAPALPPRPDSTRASEVEVQAVVLQQRIAKSPRLVGHERTLSCDGVRRRWPSRLVANATHQREGGLPGEDPCHIVAIEPGLRDDSARQPVAFREPGDVTGFVGRRRGIPFRVDIDGLADPVADGVCKIVRRKIAPLDRGVIAVAKWNDDVRPQPGVIVGDRIPEVLMGVDDLSASQICGHRRASACRKSISSEPAT